MKRASVILILVLMVFGVSSGEEVKLSELPQPVRATIEKQMKGFEIEEIERDSDDGKIVYEAKADGDKDMQIKIAEDGTLLENYRKTHLYGDSERLVWDFGRSDFPAVMVNGFPIRGDGKNLQ